MTKLNYSLDKKDKNKTNNLKNHTPNYDSSGYNFVGPLSRGFGMVRVISDVLGDEELTEKTMRKLIDGISKYEKISYYEYHAAPSAFYQPGKKYMYIDNLEVQTKIMKDPTYKLLDSFSQKFAEEIERQRNEIISQENARKTAYSESLNKYRITQTVQNNQETNDGRTLNSGTTNKAQTDKKCEENDNNDEVQI